MIVSTNILYLRLGITIILCLIGFFVPRNRVVFTFQAIWLIIITSFNTYSVDWLGNEQLYDGASFSANTTNISNFAYNWVASISKNLGLTFTQFNGWLAFLSTILIVIVILKLSKSPNIVLSFWYIFPFIDNVIQKRAYYALGLTCLAMPLLFNKKSKLKNYILFEIIVFIASQFHELVLFYLTLPLFLVIKEKWRKYFIFILVALEIVGKSYFVSLINNATGGEKSSYFTGTFGSISTSVVFLLIFWQLAQLGIIYFLNKNKSNNTLLSINVWALTLLPLYSFGAVFTRVYRSVIFLNDIAVSNEFDEGTRVSAKSILLLVFQIGVLLIGFIISDLNGIGGIDNMVFTIFRNNWLLNL